MYVFLISSYYYSNLFLGPVNEAFLLHNRSFIYYINLYTFNANLNITLVEVFDSLMGCDLGNICAKANEKFVNEN
jgi:hypothetical protein